MNQRSLLTGLAISLLLGMRVSSAGVGPSPEALRQTIRDYIAAQEKLQGAFAIVDKKSGALRQLKLVRVHDRVGKTGNYYYSCTDMTDVATQDLLDLDFDIEDQAGNLKVAGIRIHKDNGKPRYTYDENDNMIPTPAE